MRWFEIPLALGAPLLLEDEEEIVELLEDEDESELDALLGPLETDEAPGAGGAAALAGAGAAGVASWLSLGSPRLP